MNDNKSISLFKVLKIALVFFVIFNFIYREIRNDREKEIYRVDVDRQIERMYRSGNTFGRNVQNPGKINVPHGKNIEKTESANK